MKTTQGWLLLGSILLSAALLGRVGASASPPNGAAIVGKGVLDLQSSVDGDPSCKSSRCDSPGFMSSAVFDMSSFQQGQLYDGTVAVPDGWTYTPNFKCRLTDHVKEIHDWFDYKSVVNAYTHTEHHGLFHSSSETHWFKAVNSITASMDSVLVRHTIVCSSYRLQRNRFSNDAVLTEAFKQDVASLLPSHEKQYNASLNDMLQFANAYGNSVVMGAEFGGKAVRMSSFSQSSFQHLRHNSGDLHSSATLNHLCSIGDDVLCNNRTPGWSAQQEFNSSAAHVLTSYVPFPPAPNDLSRGANAWALAVQQDPGLVHYTLQNLSSILSSDFFPDDPAISTRAALYKRFLDNDYCSLRAGGCPSLPPRSARWSSATPASSTFQPTAGHAAVVGTLPSLATPATMTGTQQAASQTNTVVFFSGVTGKASLPNISPVQQYVPTADASAKPSTAPHVRSSAPPSSSPSTSAPWTLLAQDLSANAANVSAAVLGDRVYITGGAAPPFTDARRTVLAYARTKNEWINVEPMGTARQLHCTFVARSTLFVAGGGTPVTEAFDPETDSWEARQPMPLTLTGMSCTVVNDSLVYVIGGMRPDGSLNAGVLLYNVDTDLWSEPPLPPMEQKDAPRMGHATALVGDGGSRILVIGGRDAAGLAARSADVDPVPSLANVRILQLPVGGSTAEWIPGCALPVGTAFAPAVSLPSASDANKGSTDIVIAGGCADSQCSAIVNTVQTYTVPLHSTIQCSETGTVASISNPRAPVPPHERPTTPTPASLRSSHLSAPWSSPSPPPPPHKGVSLPGSGVSTVSGEVLPARIFDAACDKCYWLHKTHDNRSVPNLLDVRSLRRCSFQTESGLIQDDVDAQVAASAWMDAEAFFGLPGLLDFTFSAAFDASLSASASTHFRRTTAHASGRCVLFDLGYLGAMDNSTSGGHSDQTQHVPGYRGHAVGGDAPKGSAGLLAPPLSPNFEAAVNRLLEAVKNEDQASSAALAILGHFGDAFVRGASFGARFTQEFEMTESHFHAALRAGVDFGYSTSHSALFFWGGSHSEDASAQVKADADLRTYTSTNRTSCVPLCPPLSNNVTINTTGFEALLSDTDVGAVPIATRVQPITAVLTHAYFPKADKELLASAAQLLKQLMLDGTYCAHTAGCFQAKRRPVWLAAPGMLPLSTSYGRAVLVNSSAALVVGGVHAGGITERVNLHRFASARTSAGAPPWAYVSPALAANASAAASVPVQGTGGESGAVWAIGNGEDPSQHTGSMVYNTTSGAWSKGPTLPGTTVQNAALAFEPVTKKLIAVGQPVGATGDDACHAYQLDATASSPAWSAQPHSTPLLCLANTTAAPARDGAVLFFGGRTPGGSCTARIVQYNVTSDEARVIGYLPRPMCSGQAHLVPRSDKGDDARMPAGTSPTSSFPGRAKETVLVVGTDTHEQDRANVWRWNMVLRETVTLPSFSRGGGADASAITTVYLPGTDELYAFGDGMLPLRLRSAFGLHPSQQLRHEDHHRDHRQQHHEQRQQPQVHSQAFSHHQPYQRQHQQQHDAKPASPLGGVRSQQQHEEGRDPMLDLHRVARRRHRAGPVEVSTGRIRGKPTLRFQQVDMMLHGYHTVRGDPFARTGTDPGWSQYPVFEVDGSTEWSGVMQVPGDKYDWSLPPGIDGQGGSGSDSCKYAHAAWHIHSSTALQHALRGVFSIVPSKKFLWPSLLGCEYSLGGTWAVVDKQTASFSADLALAIGRCTRYTLSRPNYASGLRFTPAFVADLRDLPTSVNTTNLGTFANFTEKYGLYLPRAIDYGSMSVQVSAVESATVRAVVRGDASLSGGAEAALLFFFDLDAAASGSASAQLAAELREAMTFNYTTCMPRCPPRVKNPSQDVSAWQGDITLPSGQVYPVGADLDPLPNVLDQSRHNLPPDLQGQALTSRLNALTQFCDHRLADLLGATDARANVLWTNASHAGEMPLPPDPSAVPTSLRHAVTGAAALRFHNDTLVIGGFNGTSPATTIVQVFSGGTWVTQGMLPAPTAYAAAAVFRDRPVVCGGVESFDNGTVAAVRRCFAAVGGEWHTQPGLQTARFGHSMVVLGDALYVIGGMASNGSAIASIEVLRANATSWTALNSTALPMGASGIATAYSHALGKAVLVGGMTDSGVQDSILVFDGATVTTISPRLALPTAVAYAAVMEVEEEWLLLTGGITQRGGGTTRDSVRIDLTFMSITPVTPPPSNWAGSALVPLSNSTGLLVGGVFSFSSITVGSTYPFMDPSTSKPFQPSSDIKIVSFQ